MRRALPLVLVVGLLSAGLGAARAAFVDTAATPVGVTADTAARWLSLDAPGHDAGCEAQTGVEADGADDKLALHVGADAATPAAGTPAPATCAFIVRAPTTLPEGADTITVRLAPGGAADQAVFATTSGDETEHGIVLAAGEQRRVLLGAGDLAAHGRVTVTVAPKGETPGFLRYEIPAEGA